MVSRINFEKATIAHKEVIFSWLAEPYIQEFWDNTQEHKDDIVNFINGRKILSNYAGGRYVYWVALANDTPFALIMIIQEFINSKINQIKLDNISKTGNTYGIDYMIGNKGYLGKGYGSKTLKQFIDFFRTEIDSKADTFFIDPASDNPRAKHVYIKAGFEHVGSFIMTGNVSGKGKKHDLLIKKFYYRK